MLTSSDLVQARACQRSIMRDTLTIERPNGTEETAYAAVTRWAPVYTGPGRIQADGNRAQVVDIGGQVAQPAGWVGAIPWDATPVRMGDRVTVSASTDPRAVGKRFVVRSVETSTYVTAQRFRAEEAIR